MALSRPEFAPAAVEKLTTAAAGYGAQYERSRAMILAPLASVQFQAGDVAAAVASGYDAVHALTGLSSTRGYARLRVLDTVAASHSGQPDVADLRERLRKARATTAA
ncbi:hypothetical protein [Amycolatopsis magusensis]|uniref:hypothetical protein n=1 Tax=Amycolatopsis magusensis TaxID=882444 RepID=UPI0024A7ED62|nr:hypothetical protein [Amycolatopsis magusensis]MDI5975942.1 hypothetical protein [Amycolatopsis magusensis]